MLALILTAMTPGLDGRLVKAETSADEGKDVVNPVTYPITIVGSQGGKAALELTEPEAEEGTAVKLIVTPDKDYKLKNLTVFRTDLSSETAGEIEDDSLVEVTPVEGNDTEYMFVMPAFAVTVEASFFYNYSGWKTVNGSRYYYTNGVKAKGLKTIEKGKYYFDANGVMKTGWQTIGGAKYYFDTKSGKALTGWKTISKYKYYFTSDAKMATGWKKIGSGRYYFLSNGKRVSGWKTISGSKYYFTSDGRVTIGWKTIKGARYYFDSLGRMAKGFKKIGKLTYYFSSAGKLQKNTIVGSSKTGYYYVDSTGVRITTPEIKKAVAFVRKYTKSGWSKSKKLKACYDALWKKYSYKRYKDSPTAKKMPAYANNMFSQKKGNCYRYAAAYAYIARVLGYDSRVVAGKISCLHGGMTPHGWAEIKVGKTWYICDANMQRNYPKINSYMRTEKTYRYRHSVSKRFKMTVKNGKVSWK